MVLRPARCLAGESGTLHLVAPRAWAAAGHGVGADAIASLREDALSNRWHSVPRWDPPVVNLSRPPTAPPSPRAIRLIHADVGHPPAPLLDTIEHVSQRLLRDPRVPDSLHETNVLV